MDFSRKLFKELKVGDKVHFIDVGTKNILDSTVIDIHHSPKGTTKFKFFRFFKTSAGLMDEDNLEAIYREQDQEGVFLDVIVLSRDSMATLLIKPPTVVCTTPEELKKWIDATAPK